MTAATEAAYAFLDPRYIINIATLYTRAYFLSFSSIGITTLENSLRTLDPGFTLGLQKFVKTNADLGFDSPQSTFWGNPGRDQTQQASVEWARREIVQAQHFQPKTIYSQAPVPSRY